MVDAIALLRMQIERSSFTHSFRRRFARDNALTIGDNA